MKEIAKRYAEEYFTKEILMNHYGIEWYLEALAWFDENFPELTDEDRAEFGKELDELLSEYHLETFKNYKEPKWLYRLESTDPNNGLWYNNNGEFCFDTGIGSLSDECKTKTLPMDYDERYKADGRDWYSSCSNKEDLLHWYSLEDANELINKGFVLKRYLAVEYTEYPNETVFIKDSCIKEEIIDINKLFSIDAKLFS
jgi:hypothetical protein